MANDFSADPSCKALLRFESGALGTDSKGGNTLTPSASSPASNTVAFKEGAGCADFENSSNQWFSRTDANLDAGFPLKNGDSVKKISVCFWCKPESSGNFQIIFNKGATSKQSFSVNRYQTTGILYLVNGYGTGVDYELWLNVATLTNGKWYHIGIAHDGVSRTVLVRIFDDTAGTAATYTHAWTNDTNVEDGPMVIGTDGDFATTNDYDGLLDELVVFNRLLAADEFDRIRAGTYAGWKPTEMYSLSVVDDAAWLGGSANYRPFLIF